MCCNTRSAHLHQNPDVQKAARVAGLPAHVQEDVVADPLPDGYWVHALPFTSNAEYHDLVAYGLGYEGKPATIRLFENPKNTGSSGWKVTEIQSFEYPVGMTHADLTGDGFNDIIIIDRYGPSMDNLWDTSINGGRLQWLRNPGVRSEANPFWSAQKIGNSTGLHRVQAGHFTRTDVWQILGLPIIPASSDLTSPAPVILYTPVYGPNFSEGPVSWNEEVIFPSHFRLIHDVKLVEGGNNGLDLILVAGREGIVSLWFEASVNLWNFAVLGQGLPQSGNNPYWGSGSVDIAAVEDDPIGYIATCEAFHGNVVSVYLKVAGAPVGPASLKNSSYWRRKVIDDYGPLNSSYTGTIHNVTTVVSDDKKQGFAAACMGAPIGKAENQGVYLYTPIDLVTGEFKKSIVSRDSASRLAVATFDKADKKDLASVTYYVPNYHTGPNPPNVRINSLQDFRPITATRLDKEVLVKLPRPASVPEYRTPSLTMMTFAGKRLSIVVIPPNCTATFDSRDAVKVIYGDVSIGGVQRRIAPPVQAADTTALAEDGKVIASDRGAVVLRVEVLSDHVQGPFRVMSDVAVTNSFPVSPDVDQAVRDLDFPFNKVSSLAWASSGLWDDFEFYNMTGVHFFFNDDSMEEICHMQAWTLGIGETARFHNHSDKAFCEIHYCLSNGGDTGGMRYFPNEYPQDPATEKYIQENELSGPFVEQNSTLLVVPTLFEHGPLWKIQPGTEATPIMRTNATVDYPWHAWLASYFGSFPLPMPQPLPPTEQAYDVWLAFEFPPSAFQF